MIVTYRDLNNVISRLENITLKNNKINECIRINNNIYIFVYLYENYLLKYEM